MRRLWFSILLVASLAVSATANAWAAQACPYKQAESAAAAHDCCPDPKPSPQPSDHHDTSMDCKLGQACRASHAVEPLVPTLAAIHVEVVAAVTERDLQGAPISLATGLWRPPRTV